MSTIIEIPYKCNSSSISQLDHKTESFNYSASESPVMTKLTYKHQLGPVTDDPDLGKSIQTGQQIRSKIDSFQNANFLISQPNSMMLQLIEIVSERRFQ